MRGPTHGGVTRAPSGFVPLIADVAPYDPACSERSRRSCAPRSTTPATRPGCTPRDGELTYAQALARVERAASALRAPASGAGDRVLVTPRNTADYLLSWFALMEVGAIQVPINPKSSAAEIAGFVQQVRPALIVTDADLAPTVDAAVGDAGASVDRVDVATLYDAEPDGRGPGRRSTSPTSR